MKSQREETKEKEIQVLTCTASEYVASKKRLLPDYELMGVNSPDIRSLKDYAKSVGAEVITNLICSASGLHMDKWIYGTALVRKPNYTP